MSISTSHQISRYYDFYRDKEIVFTKANIKSLRLDPRQIYIKKEGGQWPYIINSASLMNAKIIIGTSNGIISKLRKSKNVPLSLRFCFIDNTGNPIQFFVNCTAGELQPYAGSKELVLLSLNYTQRPPDDLIYRLGEFIEVNENFKNRKEERISITKNSLRELQIPKEETYIFISGVPRKCILKDLSFGGAKIMLIGIPKFLNGKNVDLRLIFFDTTEKISLKGVIKNANFFPDRKDMVICHIEFIPDLIPMTYKFKINSYITSYQKQMIENSIINQKRTEQQELQEQLKELQRKQKIEAQNSKDAQQSVEVKTSQNVQTSQSSTSTQNVQTTSKIVQSENTQGKSSN